MEREDIIVKKKSSMESTIILGWCSLEVGVGWSARPKLNVKVQSNSLGEIWSLKLAYTTYLPTNLPTTPPHTLLGHFQMIQEIEIQGLAYLT